MHFIDDHFDELSHSLSLQGAPVEKKVLPEKVSYYRESRLPHTQAGTVGASLSSPHSRDMLQLERLTYHGKKRSDIHNNYQFSY